MRPLPELLSEDFFPCDDVTPLAGLRLARALAGRKRGNPDSFGAAKVISLGKVKSLALLNLLWRPGEPPQELLASLAESVWVSLCVLQ